MLRLVRILHTLLPMSVLSTRLDEQGTTTMQSVVKRVFAQLAKADTKGALKAFTKDATILRNDVVRAIGALGELLRTKELAVAGIDWLPSKDVAVLDPALRLELFAAPISGLDRVGLVHFAALGSEQTISLGVVLAGKTTHCQLRSIFDPVPFIVWGRTT